MTTRRWAPQPGHEHDLNHPENWTPPGCVGDSYIDVPAVSYDFTDDKIPLEYRLAAILEAPNSDDVPFLVAAARHFRDANAALRAERHALQDLTREAVRAVLFFTTNLGADAPAVVEGRPPAPPAPPP